ncbi:MAG: alanine--glyoxylate aminotransferase family protein [Cellvibrionales bacterium]|nr:alanine--glyoxylate aminotransferase family protein [Cellvibrionales bacterium]
MIVQVPKISPLTKVLPDEPLLMMGAGPVPIPSSVSWANSIVINHLGETMATIVHQVKAMARYVFQTESKWVLGVAGPGSAAMEMAVANMIWPGEKVLSVCNGFFSERLAEMARRSGGEVVTYQAPEKHCADLDAVKQAIIEHQPKVLTIVQGETSHTVFNRFLPEIAAFAQDNNCQVIVDAVCTLSTMPLSMDDWGIDAVITGGQKGLSSIPGVSLIGFSENAWQRINSRPCQQTHWCLDATLAKNFWHDASYHYTAPVSGLLALHEALRLICDETLEARFARHLRCSHALQKGIEAMGLSLYASEASRLNSVIGICLPDDVKPGQICKHISEHYRVEISGSFGPNIVRIGQMGEQSREHHLFRALHAFGATMRDFGLPMDIPNGMAELEKHLQVKA